MEITTKAIRVANATTVFGEVLPVGTQIYDVSETKLYILTSSALATDTLTTANTVEIGAGGGSAIHEFGDFTYASSTTPPPPIGDFIFDNASPAAATKLHISDLTASGTNVRGDLLSMRVGSNFKLTDKVLGTNNMNFHVTAITGKTGYVEYAVDHVHTNGTITAGHTFTLENIPAAVGGVTDFVGLTDTPADYVGHADEVATVNTAEDALVFNEVAVKEAPTDGKVYARYNSGWAEVDVPIILDNMEVEIRSTSLMIDTSHGLTLIESDTRKEVFHNTVAGRADISGLVPGKKYIIQLGKFNNLGRFSISQGAKSIRVMTIGDIEILNSTDQYHSFNGSFGSGDLLVFTVDSPDVFAKVIDFDKTWTYASITSFPYIDISNGVSFNSTWHYCASLSSFPALDFSNGVKFSRTWAVSTKLTCIAGTLDFRKITDGGLCFDQCPVLTAPASSGTPVRVREHAVAGIWTNPNPCPPIPVAQFTGTPLSGIAPLDVIFTDGSTNTPTSWAWDFGDGNTSTDQNPHHTYATAGTYTVILIATNTSGSNTMTKTDYITVT